MNDGAGCHPDCGSHGFTCGRPGCPGEEKEPLAEVAEKRLCTALVEGVRCPGLPQFTFLWPGATKPARQCVRHTLRARHIAEVLGFELVVTPIAEHIT